MCRNISSETNGLLSFAAKLQQEDQVCFRSFLQHCLPLAADEYCNFKILLEQKQNFESSKEDVSCLYPFFGSDKVFFIFLVHKNNKKINKWTQVWAEHYSCYSNYSCGFPAALCCWVKISGLSDAIEISLAWTNFLLMLRTQKVQFMNRFHFKDCWRSFNEPISY